MRPIDKGPWPLKRGNRRRVFNDHVRAIPHLKDRTGKYCHLCEMRVTNALAIEHIKPQEHFPKLTNHWENFLLICGYCNSHKNDTIPVSPYRKNYLWPHLNNTLKAFKYSITGIVELQGIGLTQDQERRAQNLIDLYGLNKASTANGEPDARFVERAEAILFAIRRRVEYVTGVNQSVDVIVDMAVAKGFFSVWLSIFNDIPIVRTALINQLDFHLTNTNCFDNQLQLINRTNTDI